MFPGRTLHEFFDQWVYGEGQIEIEYKTETVKSEKDYLVKIQLQQVQDGYEEFHFPLEVKLIFEDATEKSIRYDISSKDTLLEISTDRNTG